MMSKIEELRARRRQLLKEMDGILDQMEANKQETLRVVEITSNTNEILESLNNLDDYSKILRGEKEWKKPNS